MYCVQIHPFPFRNAARKMSSVLNVGVMSSNPVGNQLRRLDALLNAERADKQMLLLALETKAPEVFAEYMRQKDEVEERLAAQQRAAQMAQQQQNPRFANSQPAGARGRGMGQF